MSATVCLTNWALLSVCPGPCGNRVMTLRHVAVDEVIIREGDRGDEMYIIERYSTPSSCAVRAVRGKSGADAWWLDGLQWRLYFHVLGCPH